MSLLINTCDEQGISFKQLLLLMIFCNENDNKYVNSCNSEFTPLSLEPLDCEYDALESILRNLVDEDISGNPCIKWVSTDNSVFFCNNLLDFSFACNSQYLNLI